MIDGRGSSIRLQKKRKAAMKYDGIDIPGLMIRKAADGSPMLYWRPPKAAEKLRYEPSSIRIHETDTAEIAALCRKLTAEVFEWLAMREGASKRIVNDLSLIHI